MTLEERFCSCRLFLSAVQFHGLEKVWVLSLTGWPFAPISCESFQSHWLDEVQTDDYKWNSWLLCIAPFSSAESQFCKRQNLFTCLAMHVCKLIMRALKIETRFHSFFFRGNEKILVAQESVIFVFLLARTCVAIAIRPPTKIGMHERRLRALLK